MKRNIPIFIAGLLLVACATLHAQRVAQAGWLVE